MAFGPTMQTLARGSALPITLKAIEPHEAPTLPEIPDGSSIDRQLPPAYVAELMALRDPKSAIYRYASRVESNLHWGIFVGQPEQQRLIGVTGLTGMCTVEPAQSRITITDERYHNRGVGRAVYPLTSSAAQEVGVEYVAAKVRLDNGPSLRLHEQIGFLPAKMCTEQGEPYGYVELRQCLSEDVLEDPQEYARRIRGESTRIVSLSSGHIETSRLRTQLMLAQARTVLAGASR